MNRTLHVGGIRGVVWGSRPRRRMRRMATRKTLGVFGGAPNEKQAKKGHGWLFPRTARVSSLLSTRLPSKTARCAATAGVNSAS